VYFSLDAVYNLSTESIMHIILLILVLVAFCFTFGLKPMMKFICYGTLACAAVSAVVVVGYITYHELIYDEFEQYKVK
jgi:hypothetical protein